jgi:outer membrane protein
MNMKMKFLLAPALVLFASSGMWAQATKVALINMQQAMANTKEGQAQIAELQKKYGPKQTEFQKRASDIQAKEDSLKKTQNTISDEAKADQETTITRLKTSLQRDSDDVTADSQQDEQKMVEGIYGKLAQVVTKYSQDNQIMLVFDVSSQPNNLICCASAPDITKDIIALYDKTNSGGTAAAPTVAKPAAPAAARPAAPAPARPAPATPTKPAGTAPGK